MSTIKFSDLLADKLLVRGIGSLNMGEESSQTVAPQQTGSQLGRFGCGQRCPDRMLSELFEQRHNIREHTGWIAGIVGQMATEFGDQLVCQPLLASMVEEEKPGW